MITDVLVEYEEYAIGNYGLSDGEPTIDIRLKTSKDNTITINRVKDNWNRDEVVELFYKLWNTEIYIDNTVTWEQENLDKWIEENL